MPIVWGMPPPQKLQHSYIRLLAVKARKSVLVARLGPVVGLLTHWTGSKTVACLGVEECPAHRCPLTWKGYCAGLAVIGAISNGRPAWRRSILVVTSEISADVAALPIGKSAVISRPGVKPNSPLELLESKIAGPDPCPEAFDVKPYVCRAMGIPYEFACVPWTRGRE